MAKKPSRKKQRPKLNGGSYHRRKRTKADAMRSAASRHGEHGVFDGRAP